MVYRRIAVRGIIFKDNRLLCQFIPPVKNGRTGFWCTPGGGLEAGESLEDGLKREMIEETGIEPKIGRLLFVQQFHDGKSEHIEFVFHIENADDYEVIDLSKTTHGLLEVDRIEFVDPSNTDIQPEFLTTIDLTAHLDTLQPIFIHNDLPLK